MKLPRRNFICPNKSGRTRMSFKSKGSQAQGRVPRSMRRPMTEDDMIGWFRAAPMGSRQQRMLWVAHKIARITGATEGGVYQRLELSLERARQGKPRV